MGTRWTGRPQGPFGAVDGYVLPYIFTSVVLRIILYNHYSGSQAQYAHVQVIRVYEHFVEQLNRLTADDVHWEPYSNKETGARAPGGLSSLCWRDRAYWRMQKKLVFDVFVEDYTVHRVMRQFGLR